MANYDANIVEIERYLRGELSVEERTSFQKRLEGDAALRAEVEVYGQILEGLEAIHSEQFAEQIGGWEKEIDRAEEQDIEQYLLGVAQGPTRERVERRRTEDPTYARRMEKVRILLEGFEAMRAEDFGEQLSRWERAESTTGEQARVRRLSPYARIAIAAGFLLVLLAGFRWYATANFGDAALLQAHYESPAMGAVMGEDQDTADPLSRRFEYAHQLLQAGNYREAVTAFEDLRLDLATAPIDEFTRSYLFDNATYSRALALLGARAPDAEVRAALQQVIENSDSDYRVEAMLLQQKIDSFWRNLGR